MRSLSGYYSGTLPADGGVVPASGSGRGFSGTHVRVGLRGGDHRRRVHKSAYLLGAVVIITTAITLGAD